MVGPMLNRVRLGLAVVSWLSLAHWYPVPALEAQQIEILLKGGHVIDPRNGIDAPMDVAISGGRIFRVAADIPAGQAERVIDVAGLYVTPGIIDMHSHLYYGTEANDATGFSRWSSVPPDGFTFRAGVTTIVDAGSSGWRNFHEFKTQTIDRSQTRVLALLSIVGSGMLGSQHAQDHTDMNPVVTAMKIAQYRDIIVGIKAHHYGGADYTPEERAVEAGNLAGVPVMVDFGGHSPPRSLEKLLMEVLRPGDMMTHTFFSSRNREGPVDEGGRLRPFILPAQQRGIVFDVGHGGGGFQWVQAVPALEQGFLPNVISTDLHRSSMNGGMKDMAYTMSKFLAAGLSLNDVVLRTTWNPARSIGREDLGHLSPGAEADVAVFNLREGAFGFLDARRTRLPGTRKLETELTLLGGRVVWDLHGLAAPEWDE